MKRAMQDAGVGPDGVQYVNAHGTSTPANDMNETKAIKAVFGDRARDLLGAAEHGFVDHEGLQFVLGAVHVPLLLGCPDQALRPCSRRRWVAGPVAT
jgi:3-oxoacyl-[acyl-carrier-protein] synthase II